MLRKLITHVPFLSQNFGMILTRLYFLNQVQMRFQIIKLHYQTNRKTALDHLCWLRIKHKAQKMSYSTSLPMERSCEEKEFYSLTTSNTLFLSTCSSGAKIVSFAEKEIFSLYGFRSPIKSFSSKDSPSILIYPNDQCKVRGRTLTLFKKNKKFIGHPHG